MSQPGYRERAFTCSQTSAGNQNLLWFGIRALKSTEHCSVPGRDDEIGERQDRPARSASSSNERITFDCRAKRGLIAGIVSACRCEWALIWAQGRGGRGQGTNRSLRLQVNFHWASEGVGRERRPTKCPRYSPPNHSLIVFGETVDAVAESRKDFNEAWERFKWTIVQGSV